MLRKLYKLNIYYLLVLVILRKIYITNSKQIIDNK